MIKKITIEVIPHLEQRYNTVGDWQFERDSAGSPTALNIKVSDIRGENDANMLVAIHEFVEAVLCELGGVKESDVDAFDMNWIPRPASWTSDTLISEPGEDYNAPYYFQHQIASGIERLVAQKLWTNWARYEIVVDKLCKDSEAHFAAQQDALAIDSGDLVEESEDEPVAGPAPSARDLDLEDDDCPF